MAAKVKVYQYPNCSTCKKALKFLDQRNIRYDSIDISSTSPSRRELESMLSANGGELRKLFNTSGKRYRELKLSEKLNDMSKREAIDLLANDGMLVKRPFLITNQVKTVGFKDSLWQELF